MTVNAMIALIVSRKNRNEKKYVSFVRLEKVIKPPFAPERHITIADRIAIARSAAKNTKRMNLSYSNALAWTRKMLPTSSITLRWSGDRWRFPGRDAS